VEATKQREEKRKKPKPDEHEGMPQHQHCPPVSVAEIGTQNAMKSSRKTLHEFTSHIPHKTPKRNISRLLFRAMLYIIIMILNFFKF
jgi:hypothetical protein